MAELPVLNRLFLAERYSLAQFMKETAPWVPNNASEPEKLFEEIVESEREFAHRLVDLIRERGGVPSAGNYPTSFTDQHFLSLDFMFDRLGQELSNRVAGLDSAKANCQEPDLTALIDEMTATKRQQAEAISKLN